MDNIRELARECWQYLAKDHADMHDPICIAIGATDFGAVDDGNISGIIRHAVEVECERRGWSCEWQREAVEWAWCAGVWDADLGMVTYQDTRDAHTCGYTALECALLALKWLLENPIEAANGQT